MALKPMDSTVSNFSIGSRYIMWEFRKSIAFGGLQWGPLTGEINKGNYQTYVRG